MSRVPLFGSLPGVSRSSRQQTIDALVEERVSPYAPALGQESLAELRALLSEMLASHPVASALVGELAPSPVVLESGEIGDVPATLRNASGEDE